MISKSVPLILVEYIDNDNELNNSQLYQLCFY